MTAIVLWVLFTLLIVVPLIYWAVRLAWWVFRMVFFLWIIAIATAGAAWRGELR